MPPSKDDGGSRGTNMKPNGSTGYATRRSILESDWELRGRKYRSVPLGKDTKNGNAACGIPFERHRSHFSSAVYTIMPELIERVGNQFPTLFPVNWKSTAWLVSRFPSLFPEYNSSKLNNKVEIAMELQI